MEIKNKAMRYWNLLLVFGILILGTPLQANAQSKKTTTEEKSKGWSVFKKEETKPAAKEKDEKKTLQFLHKDAKKEVKATKKESKAADKRERAARARAEAIKADKKALRREVKAEKATKKAIKVRAKTGSNS